MATKLIAESGSTKTDWVLLHKGKKKTFIKTEGINPYLQSSEDIQNMLKQQFKTDADIDEVFFYGAGINGKANKKIVARALSHVFKTKEVEVESDLLAAARGLCGRQPGMVCILGTGSNACFYDGKKIKDQLPSLGYIAGDEGSGNALGKKILQYYAYKTFDEQLSDYFEKQISSDINTVIRKLYKEPFPNRYLAGFVPMLVDNRGHFMVENILEDTFMAFFHQYLYKFRQSWKYPINFTGSVAFLFADVLKELCKQFEFELGNIRQNPLEGLIDYHTSQTP